MSIALSEADLPLVSVLVPVFNEASVLEDTLQALRHQTIRSAEFLFIDGGSTDGTGDLIRAAMLLDSRVRFLANPARHIPYALNIGLRAARGEFIARMDAHTVYPPHYLEDGVERLRVGDVQWASGPQVPVGRDTGSRRVALALSCRLGIGGASFRRANDREFTSDTGFTGVWKKSLLDDLDGWDESWLKNEDGELAGRILGGGGSIVCIPSMASQYIPRGSLGALASQYWAYGQYRAKTCGRHPSTMRRSHVLPPTTVLASVAALSPSLVGRTARVGLVGYALFVLATARRAARTERPRDHLGVAGALATMHFAWGAGFIVGSARFGLPLRALSMLAKVRPILESDPTS